MQALLFNPHAEETAILTMVLQQAGFTVRAVRNLDQAIQDWPDQPSDLIMITLPKDQEKTIRQAKQLRAHTAVPIVVLYDQLSSDQHVELLEAGVDFVTPSEYNTRVLLAEIRALLRRTAGMPFFSLPTLTQEKVSLDPGKRTVTVGEEQPKRLTQLEFRLLYTLMTHAGQIIPTENIVEHVWGYSGEGNRELVRGLIQRLRVKVEPEPHKPRYILNEPNVGYYFEQFPEEGN